jgi:hypothetical protein
MSDDDGFVDAGGHFAREEIATRSAAGAGAEYIVCRPWCELVLRGFQSDQPKWKVERHSGHQSRPNFASSRRMDGRFQSFIVPSLLPEASVQPSGLNASAVTAASCACQWASSLPLRRASG